MLYKLRTILKDFLPPLTLVTTLLTVVRMLMLLCCLYSAPHDSGSRIPCNLHSYPFTGIKIPDCRNISTFICTECMLSYVVFIGVGVTFCLGGDQMSVSRSDAWCTHYTLIHNVLYASTK